MRWFRSITLTLLMLLLLLVAIPGIRWFQTRKDFVPIDPGHSELAYSLAPAPEEILLPRAVPAAEFNRSEPVEDYLARQKMLAAMEKYRIAATGHYDLRPYLSEAGMKIPPDAMALWDADSGMALLKLPPKDLEEARMLVGEEPDEWEHSQLELRATLVAVERSSSAEFLMDFHDLNLEWITGLPPEKFRIIHRIAARGRSGERMKTVSGEPDLENEEDPGNYVALEVDPLLGADDLSIDVNFAFDYHQNDDSGEPLNLKVITYVTISVGQAFVLELATRSGDGNSEDSLTAYYLVLQVDRISGQGRRMDLGR